MPACPECGSEVEIGAVECPSCGVYPGVFGDDAEVPIVRTSALVPIPEDPPFSFPRAALQALIALFATLALIWWAHGSLTAGHPIAELLPEITLRLNRGFSIAIPAVLLVGVWALLRNRRDSWAGYGVRYVTLAAIATGIVLGPSYLERRDEVQIATQPAPPEDANPNQPASEVELPSTGIPALDAQLKALHQATLKAQELQEKRQRELEDYEALDQSLGYSQQAATPPRRPRLDPDELAQCMTDSGAILYGTPWCGACDHQKRAFGTSLQFINYVDCDSEPEYCAASRIRAYPTWEIDGRKYQGSRPLPELAKLAGCAPESLAGYPEPKTAPTAMLTRASYTWRDENGTLHVTSAPPPPGAQRIEVVQ